jgi:hypothetical protein
MKKSYIATQSEASALHSGEQTAIIVKMGKQPPAYGCSILDNQILYEDPQGNVHSRTGIPYALNEPVYVREKCYQLGEYKLLSLGETGDYEQQFCTDHIFRFGAVPNNPHRVVGAASMPRSAARTFFEPVSCEAVRVQGITANMILSIISLNTIYNRNAVNIMSEFHRHIVPKIGQTAWDNNDYVFYYKIEKITN